ncbi:MAG: hypothetical protein Ct9H300mP1_30250 [Planctomycetaceae bacterium]|nr:MAG: hypothetical protein Ct9H300mP1_30250 [Planctomycetaceae bacterium]
MAGGCNAHGVSGSAGIGRHVVESLGDHPSEYVSSLSPDRFTTTVGLGQSAARARNVYEHYYAIDHSPRGGPAQGPTPHPTGTFLVRSLAASSASVTGTRFEASASNSWAAGDRCPPGPLLCRAAGSPSPP